MFIGHYGVALGAKRLAPRVSLGTLFLAAQWLDLLWPLFLLLGWEHVRIAPGNTVVTPLDFYDYPFTHSLLAALVWSLLLGGVYFVLRRRRREALVVGAAVLSHWVLDFIVHRPDLPLLPGSSLKVGLGLWNSVAATAIVEGAIFLVGLFFYVRTTAASDRIGRHALWTLVTVLVVLWTTALRGTPPPSVRAVAWVGLGQWLFVAWFYWIDAHRRVEPPGS